jgi:ABC-type phosphate transport system substrate-binding protein
MNKTRWLILLAVFISSWSAARAQDVLVVANKDVQISEIKSADLRGIFKGEKTRFADGSHAVPVILKGGPAHEVFLKNHVGEGPDEFRAQWRKAVFTGQGAMPRAFDSETAMIECIASTPGAIGYVSRISPQAGLKIISVVK